jgi:hypothetical protein
MCVGLERCIKPVGAANHKGDRRGIARPQRELGCEFAGGELLTTRELAAASTVSTLRLAARFSGLISINSNGQSAANRLPYSFTPSSTQPG